MTEIITIGNELTEGRIPDTNAKWLAERMTMAGFTVSRISSVRDDKKVLSDVICEAAARSDVVILSGGLGPTSDDVTKEALCDFSGSKLIENKKVLSDIKKLLGKRGLKLNENNRKQCEIPAGSKAIANPIGTAPGIWIEKDGKVIVALPGVPFELENMAEKEVLPRLKASFRTPSNYFRTVMTSGSFEAMLAEILADFEKQLPQGVSLAYLSYPGVIKLRLGAIAMSDKEAREMVEREVEKLNSLIPGYITGYDDETLQMTVGRLLKASGMTLSTAESCTGGRISSMIVSVPGSSEYFRGGIVAYSNELKRKFLEVDGVILDKFGAVSRQTVEAMAKNSCRITGSDYSIAVSGIAGPEGGTSGKPVGTVCISVNSPSGCVSEKSLFGDNRERNIQRASVAALNMLRKRICEEEG